MDIVAVVAGVLLGLSFLVAGGSKIAAAGSWPEQARGLGAPAWTTPLVPWVELALGALLVTQVAPVPAGIAAIALLVVFSALIARRLAAGEHPPCACFGAWSASSIGWRHLVRNVVLIALGVVVVLGA